MKLALIGYGKMGHMIEDIARQRGHEIVCIIDVNNTDDFESPAFRSADVAIEFTSPSAAYGNYLRAWKQGVKVVSGSTGWLKEHEADVRRACSEEGHTLFWASNFSLGVAIFSAVNKYLARIMNAYPSYDVSEVETHHVHKLDAPSGTAITLAEQVCAELDRKDTWVKGEVHNANGTITGTKNTPENLLRIDAIREGEVPGIHTLTYDSPADMIQITHSAHNRSDLPSAQCSLQNSPPPTKDYSLPTTSSNSKPLPLSEVWKRIRFIPKKTPKDWAQITP